MSVWNNMSVCKQWQDFYFWMNYGFKVSYLFNCTYIRLCVCRQAFISALFTTVVNSWVMLSDKREFCSPWQQTTGVEVRRMAGLGGHCCRWLLLHLSCYYYYFFNHSRQFAAFYWDSFQCVPGGIISSTTLEELRSAQAHKSLQYYLWSQIPVVFPL